jgi:hypothetical protein
MASLSDIVSGAAPILGKVIGSFVPGGSLIVDGLSKLFGATSEDDLKAKIASDPEAYLKLQAFEKAHEAEILRLLLLDKQNAREREMTYTKATGKRDNLVAILAIIVILGYFALLGAGWFVTRPWLEKTLSTSIDEWKMCVMLVLAYFFGSMNKSR